MSRFPDPTNVRVGDTPFCSDQIRRCLKMNGLDDRGLKPKLAARLHQYLVRMEAEDDENADPNIED